MPLTYVSKAKQTLLQPIFKKFRQTYRGHRNSVVENRELNFFHIDINKLNSLLSKSESKIDNIAKDFIGDLNNISEYDKLNDGLFYDLSPIKVYYKEADSPSNSVEQNLILSKTNRISAMISRIDKKITRLERQIIWQI